MLKYTRSSLFYIKKYNYNFLYDHFVYKLGFSTRLNYKRGLKYYLPSSLLNSQCAVTKLITFKVNKFYSNFSNLCYLFFNKNIYKDLSKYSQFLYILNSQNVLKEIQGLFVDPFFTYSYMLNVLSSNFPVYSLGLFYYYLISGFNFFIFNISFCSYKYNTFTYYVKLKNSIKLFDKKKSVKLTRRFYKNKKHKKIFLNNNNSVAVELTPKIKFISNITRFINVLH